jgi:TonB family protein
MNTKGRIEPTDEEIRQQMDFDGLLKAYQTTKSVVVNNRSTYWKNLILLSVLTMVSIYGIYKWQKNISAKNNPTDAIKTTTPVSEKPPVSKNTRTQLDTSYKTNTKQSVLPTTPKVLKSPNPVVNQKQINDGQSHYINAEPVDGFPSLYAYFDRELKYPTEATIDSIQGVQSVAFIIDKMGKLGKIEILQSLGPAFDKEVLRILEHMPPWKPALLNGQPVPSKISLPFSFRITTGKH